jgi:adenylosuccinate lyase
MIERYTLPVMARIWGEQNKFARMLEVELAVCEALARKGKIPRRDFLTIKKKARFSLPRIKQLERKTRHDIVAFVNNLSENIGPASRHLHRGITSNDVIDTAQALLLKEAVEVIIKDAAQLTRRLAAKARRYKNTLCVARTHGIHAEPTTFGLKLLLFYAEMQRNLKRLQSAKDSVCVGKISGAVGTYAHLAPDVERYVCRKLDIKAESVSNQVVQRDRHAEFLCVLALVGTTLEKIATEIRHLQRSEVGEAEEGFYRGQKGSSAMPHKRNPIICERICGLARVLRAHAAAALQNNALWHERDISHSSVERIILPDSTALLDYMLVLADEVIKNMRVSAENMRRNLLLNGGLIFSQRVLIELMNRGLERPTAYNIVQSCARRSLDKKADFKSALLQDTRVKRYLSSAEIEDCFNLSHYTKHVNKIYRKLGL